MTVGDPAPAAVLDALGSLLEAELNSLFRFMDEGSPYLSRATAELHRPLQEMVSANARHAANLAAMIEALGGQPPTGAVQPEEQYLAFLSFKFLLPKLADSKRLTIRRYENVIRAVGAIAPRDVANLLEAHLAEHHAHLAALEKAAACLSPRKA